MIYKVLKTIQEAEKELLFDVEANGHHYDIDYINDKLVISIVDSYTFYDECNNICTKSNKEAISTIKCPIEAFINLVIKIYDAKIDIIRSDYSYFVYENGYVIPKININQVGGLK